MIEEALKEMLEEFDYKWTNYEKCHVFELMVIETDSRRYIVESIELDNSFLSN